MKLTTPLTETVCLRIVYAGLKRTVVIILVYICLYRLYFVAKQFFLRQTYTKMSSLASCL